MINNLKFKIMRHTALVTLFFALFSLVGLQAQVNENIKKETTVKKTTVKDTNVETVIDKEVKQTKSVIKVEGTEDTNQNSEEVIVSDEKNHTVEVIEKEVNIENEKALEELKKEQVERIDGQQRGIPVQTDADVIEKPKPSNKTKKVEVKTIDGQQRGAPTQMGDGASEKPKISNTTKKEEGGGK